MDTRQAGIAAIKAQLALLEAGTPASSGNADKANSQDESVPTALAEALQRDQSGQKAKDFLNITEFAPDCGRFGHHHPRAGGAALSIPHELSPSVLVQSVPAYQQAVATNKNEEARLLQTLTSAAVYGEVGALGLAASARQREGLEASARALKASVLATLPAVEDPEEAGLSESEKADRVNYSKVFQGLEQSLTKFEEDLGQFFGGFGRACNTVGGSFTLLGRGAELCERFLAPPWQVTTDERNYHRANARVASAFRGADPVLEKEREQFITAHTQARIKGYIQREANRNRNPGNGGNPKPRPAKGKGEAGGKPDKGGGQPPKPADK